MSVQVTKIDNGYLVTNIADDGSVIGTTAILKTGVGTVPTASVGRAITKILGKITVTKKAKRARKEKVAPATVAA